MYIRKYGDRYWAVYDGEDNLICVTVYKKGALEVLRRLSDGKPEPDSKDHSSPTIVMNDFP